MKYYLFIFLLSSPAFACNGKISPSDFALAKAKTPNLSIRIDCTGATCLCIPNGEFVNTDSAQYMTIDAVNKILVVDAQSKATYLAQGQANITTKDPNSAAIQAARAEIAAATTAVQKAQAVFDLLKAREGL